MPVRQYDSLLAKKIAKALVEIEAIKLNPQNPFTWASGWKSPIYCDNRLSLSFPAVRSLVKESLTSLIKTSFEGAEVIAGVATAGIPQGALVADALGLPFIYVRTKSKDHGMGNQVEGAINPGARVVMVEDLISTGGSSLQAIEAVRGAGMNVLGMAAIFTYGFAISEENFEKHHVDLRHLSDYESLIEQMVEDQKLDHEQLATLRAWRTNPAQWGG